MSAKRACVKHSSKHFPLSCVDDVVELFRDQIQISSCAPDLAWLSIVLGAIETSLTCEVDVGSSSLASFPVVRLTDIESLYQRFASLLRGYISASDIAQCHHGQIVVTSRELVKKVSDVIWSCLSSSYHKDRAHIQSLYSLLTGSKLDCFGVAMCIVAGCQLLTLDDVHLAMSEDHVWVVFGENGSETSEVTWHGKCVEDRRGQSIASGVTSKSWLYLNGHNVICSRYTELAAIVASINPSLSTTADSSLLSTLQQRLLWLLCDAGHLDKYPIAMSILADMEELNPTSPISPLFLYHKAIDSAQTNYADMHVYPYTYLGGYYYRHRRFRDALSAWADAADVISNYNYSRDDEEVYKEFLEIANEIIPQILRMDHECGDELLTCDTGSYVSLLRLYDGLCRWEEDSNTPVLHITWATHMIASISKFDASTRKSVQLIDGVELLKSKMNSEQQNKQQTRNTVRVHGRQILEHLQQSVEDIDVSTKPCNLEEYANTKISQTSDLISSPLCDNQDLPCTENVKDQLATCTDSDDDSDDRNSEIIALAHACCESLLNPDFLHGTGEPFVKQPEHQLVSVATNTQMDLNAFASCNTSPSVSSPLQRSIRLVLHSAKMAALKELLVAAKLNSNAIKLQLTAQSQVHVKHARRSVLVAEHAMPKYARKY